MMDVQNNESFLYKVKPGLVRSGYGIKNASNLIKKEIIERANKFWERLKQ
jgi:DNA mismatch repair ATPase MutS